MGVLAALGMIMLSADVQMTLAPDQPLAYVYVDDPLVVEFVASEEVTARVRLRIQAVDGAESAEISLGDLQLQAKAPRWCAVKDAPLGRGLYTVEGTVEIREDVQKKSARFCRVDRASAHHALPFCVTAGDECDTRFLLGLKSVGVATLRLDAAREDFASRAKEAVELGLSVVAAVDRKSYAAAGALLAGMDGREPGPVRWDVEYNGDHAAFSGLVDSILKSAGNAQIAVVVPDLASLEAYFAACDTLPVFQCVLSFPNLPTPSEVGGARMLALRHGSEGWKINVRATGSAPDGVKGAQSLLKRCVELLTAGVSEIGVDARTVYAGGELLDTAGYLNGMAVRLDGGQYAGTLPLAEGVHAPLFYREGRWLAVLWSGGETEVTVPLDGVVNPEFTDALGNPVESPGVQEAKLTVKVDAVPAYMSGTGGIIPGKAARSNAVEIASRLLSDADTASALPPALKDIVKAVQSDTGGQASRGRFLEIVRYLPRMEEQWHAGQMPVQAAVPAMSELARLIRSLCLVEDDRGEPFLEPMTDTIARCEELQSLYLTGSPARPDERLRGEWLLREVRRLVEEAEALERDGRRVEASAVATLAQWRAECLPSAARAASAPQVAAPPAPSPAQAAPAPAKPSKEEKSEKSDKADKTGASEEKKADEKHAEKVAAAKAEEKAPSAPAQAAGTTKEIVHVVAKGDNPSVIAGKYGVSLEELLSHNKMKKNVRLNIGDKVMVPAKETSSKAADSGAQKKSKGRKRR